MPRFTYSARDRAGKSVADTVDAPARKDALRILAARGLQVESVTELTAAAGKVDRRGHAKTPARDVVLSRTPKRPDPAAAPSVRRRRPSNSRASTGCRFSRRCATW